MTRDDIIRMAREGGGSDSDPSDLLTVEILERFTELISYEKDREIKRLRADAERYRWLRDKAPPDIGDIASVRDSHDPSEIDAAIDAARGEK